MTAITSFLRKTPITRLKDYFAAGGFTSLPPIDWAKPEPEVVEPLVKAVDGMSEDEKQRVILDAGRVAALADEPGQNALQNVVLNNHFVAPVDGTYLFGATLLYKVNASTSARMSGRLALNGTTEIRGSSGEISGAHVSEATALWLQTMVSLTAGDTVELQGNFRAADGYFAADQTSFWGCKIG